ncbi:M48 family metallopeptidase [Pseudoroseomonas cervicalis]|uniref:M48 family metallopeptidase n=1 Tax=Teichococcus cervicalis TaxID=204525 RepID=UPI0022F18624|nr:M48 family metallopeptidase [Pseudoroseomonas cervicalis]WBV44890.1 M48 family metallopeptidase [Pseudoroseomonas cervicalis]
MQPATSQSALRRAATLIAITLLVPLLLAGAAHWQDRRASQAVAALQQEQATLQHELARLEEYAARNPRGAVRMEGRSYTAELAASWARHRQTKLEGTLAIADYRAMLPPVARGMALAAAALGGFGLLAALLLGRLGRASRAWLLTAFGLVRRALPLHMGAQLLLLTGALLLLLGYEIAGLWGEGQVGRGEIWLAIMAGMLGLGALTMLGRALRQLRTALALFEPEPLPLIGRCLDETAAPGLWRELRGLATRSGAALPDQLVLGLTDGFFVTSGEILLQPEQRRLRGRTLHVPLPLLAALDRAEALSIIGHELGHFSGADTEYSRRFAPIYAGVARSLDAVAQHQADNLSLLTRPALMLGEFVMRQFDHAVHHWSRQREFAADGVGAWLTSPQAAASALLRSAALAQPLHDALVQAVQAGPEAAPDLLAATLERVPATALDEPLRHLEERQPHPTDTHPPASQRLAALGEAPSPALLARAARPLAAADSPLAAWFADPQAVALAASADLRRDIAREEAAMAGMLRATAEAVQEGERPLHPNTRRAGQVLLAIAALMLLGGGGIAGYLALYAPQVERAAWIATVGVLPALGLMLGLTGWLQLRRARHPFLLLSPEGFAHPAMIAPVPWRDLADLQVSQAQYSLVTEFRLHRGRPMPQLRRKTARLRIDIPAKRVTLHSTAPQGLRPQAYLELLLTYWHAALARDELAGLAVAGAQEPATPPGQDDPDATLRQPVPAASGAAPGPWGAGGPLPPPSAPPPAAP